MDVIKVTVPTSWTGDPNPADWQFLLSLREALNERAAFAEISWVCPPIQPYLPFNREVMRAMQNVLFRLIPKFVNLEFNEYAEDLSDYPRFWTVSELVTAEHNFLLMPSPGSLSSAWTDWLKAMKYIVCKLTHLPYNKFHGKLVSGFGSIHDPPFDEAVAQSIQDAQDARRETAFTRLPNTFYAWSGNTHYFHRPDADQVDGYCGYADYQAIHVTKVVLPQQNVKVNILFKTFAAEPGTPCSFSSVLEKSVFVGGDGLQEGVMDHVFGVSSSAPLDIWFGPETNIPQNAVVPVSTFASSDNETDVRRSTKTGFEAKLFCVLDLTPGLNFK